MKPRITYGIVVAAVVLAATVVVSASAASKHRTFHFVDTSVGASIGGDRSVAVVHDPSDGQGASVETVKLNGLSGTGRVITYFGTGTTTDVVTFKVGVPNANGISTLTGSGRQVGATGEFKGSKASSTISGTYDTKTTISHVTIKGQSRLETHLTRRRRSAAAPRSACRRATAGCPKADTLGGQGSR